MLFTSDNGGMLHVTGQQAWRAGHQMNGELLGFKFGAWEGGHRIPLIARWPGRIPAGTVSDQLISHVDLLATFAAIVGRELPPGEGVDSIDQLESLTATPESPPRSTLIISPNSPKHLALRHGRWMFIPERGAGGFQGDAPGAHLFAGAAALDFAGRTNSDVADGRVRDDAPPGQLYDLQSDPRQTENVYADHPALVVELAERLDEYVAQIPSSARIGWINLRQ